MAKLVPGKNGNGMINRWEKGDVTNPAGRPRKYISQLKAEGYKMAEIKDCIQVLLSMTETELLLINDNPLATILEKTIANALIKSHKKGSLYSVETLLTRAHGKPEEKQQVTNDGVVEVIFTKGKTIL